MKLNRILTMCAVVATLCLSADTLLAQNGGGNGGGNGFGGGNGGNGFGGGGRGNFDPAQRLANADGQHPHTVVNFTNDTDWAAIQPLVQKVLDARTALGNAGRGGFGGGRGGRRGGGGQGGPGFGQTRQCRTTGFAKGD